MARVTLCLNCRGVEWTLHIFLPLRDLRCLNPFRPP